MLEDKNPEIKKKNEELLASTIKKILGHDSYYIPKYDEGYTFINDTYDLFYSFDMNRLVKEFLKKKYFRKKYENYKFIYFTTRELDKDLKKLKKIKEIEFGSCRYLRKPDVKLSIPNLINLNKKWSYFILEQFLKSIYYHKDCDSLFHYSTFRDRIMEVIKENKLFDMKKIIESIHEYHVKEGFPNHNFKHICYTRNLPNFFSENSKLNNFLDKYHHINFNIDNVSKYDSIVYKNVLCLLLFYIIEYYKNKKIKAVIVIDNLIAFHSLQQVSSGDEKISDIFYELYNSLQGRSLFEGRREEGFPHKTIFSLFTKDIAELGEKDEEIAENLEILLRLNLPIIFEINSKFLYFVQRYLNWDIRTIYRLIESGKKIMKFFDSENKKSFPFVFGFPGEVRSSDDLILFTIPIDFTEVETLETEEIFEICNLKENENIEFKSKYSGCEKKIINTIKDFLNCTGGNIFIGFKQEGDLFYPKGINLKEESKKKKFGSISDLVDSISQKISSNLISFDEQTPIKIKTIPSKSSNFIIITVWPEDRNIVYRTKWGGKDKRFESIRFTNEP